MKLLRRYNLEFRGGSNGPRAFVTYYYFGHLPSAAEVFPRGWAGMMTLHQWDRIEATF